MISAPGGNRGGLAHAWRYLKLGCPTLRVFEEPGLSEAEGVGIPTSLVLGYCILNFGECRTGNSHRFARVELHLELRHFN
jgi:hypothetical protein